jgi:hypothetical protein
MVSELKFSSLNPDTRDLLKKLQYIPIICLRLKELYEGEY